MNGINVPYHDHLKENMPMTCPNNWVVDKRREKYGASSHYPRVEENVPMLVPSFWGTKECRWQVGSLMKLWKDSHREVVRETIDKKEGNHW